MSFIKCLFALLALTILGCDTLDDLAPSGDDKRSQVEAGSVGPWPGQIGPNFSTISSVEKAFELNQLLNEHQAVVLYFTMWCPTCLSHSDHMLNHVHPTLAEPEKVAFVLVDYVSGTAKMARANEMANGYANSLFTVVADTELQIYDLYDAAMGTTVVMDSDGLVYLNEDYRNGDSLLENLNLILGPLNL